MNYARALKILRSIKEISQQELSQKTSLSKSLISRIESGERSLSEANKNKIAKKFNISPDLIDLLAYKKTTDTILSENDLTNAAKALLQILHSVDE